MNGFVHDDFLLTSSTARRLYHEHAAPLPIIDYHNHLNPLDLAEDRAFENLTQLWIASDPYKHRAMRIAGVPERLITGDATDREKFDAWAATLPQTLGNPLFAWSALELDRFFGISEFLGPASSDRIWHACNEKLRAPEFHARQLIARANVECLCTSDPLGSDLQAHAALAASGFAPRVLPSLRIDSLPSIEGNSLAPQLDLFGRLGCRLADHSLTSFAADSWQVLAAAYRQRDWILQLHMGAERATSSRLRSLAGPAGGYATIGNSCDIAALCRFLDGLEGAGALPRVILYPLNPADYPALATLTGSFAEDGIRGKIQLGPAWWYNDHALGIRQHLDALSSYGLLSTFIGMTTDSRSLLSMVRHEYFRRVLCDWLGDQIEAGTMPGDSILTSQLVRAIAYDNAKSWILTGSPNTD